MKHVRLKLLSLVVAFLALLPARGSSQSSSSSQSVFPVPPGLESSVDFWKKIFSEYGFAQLVFFDPQDLTKVYEVVEVGEDSRSNSYINRERVRIAAAHGVDIERVRAQRGVKERTAAGIKQSGRYITQIQQIFRERGLPTELSYLPIVESSYDIYARSSAGAVGIWQFMPRTGRQYMRVSRAIDERKDPLDSTRAAATYLQQAYDTLGSWPLAITSYNFGIGGIARATGDAGSNDLMDLIQRYSHKNWGFAPKQFYAEFLAAIEIGTNYRQYFPGLELDAAAPMQEIEITAKTSVTSLTKAHGMSRDELLGWNPALSRSLTVVPAGYRLKLPSDRTIEPPVAIAATKDRTGQSSSQPQVVHHHVKRGETLIQIARRYGASVQGILQANGLRRANMLRAGTTLVIPQI